MGNRETPLLDDSAESSAVATTVAGFRVAVAKILWYSRPFWMFGALSAIIVVLGLCAFLSFKQPIDPDRRWAEAESAFLAGRWDQARDALRRLEQSRTEDRAGSHS